MADVNYCSQCNYFHQSGLHDKNYVSVLHVNTVDLKSLLVKYRKLGKRWRKYFSIEDDVDLLVMEVVDGESEATILLSNGAKLLVHKSDNPYNNYVWVKIDREDAIDE